MDDEEADPEMKIRKLPEKKNIYINNVSYQYEDPPQFALKDIDLLLKKRKQLPLSESVEAERLPMKLLLDSISLSVVILVGHRLCDQPNMEENRSCNEDFLFLTP